MMMVMWRRRNVAVVVAVVLLLLEALFIRVTAVKDPSPPHEREEDYDYYCSTETDRVTVVPGYPALQPPGGCWYSGYLHYEVAGQQIHTHYTLQVAEPWTDSDLDDDAVPHGRRPSNQSKPLIYWSNGGPGASSLFGLLTEIGPLLLNDRSLQTDDYRRSKIPTPLYNPHAWTRLGHVLAFDQPAPVGFSYCNTLEEHARNPHSCGGIVWTDELAAEAAFKALLAFYDKFPVFSSHRHDLYLVGESYAGIYIPTLARQIVRYNTNQTNTSRILPLVGFAVGDGCLGTNTGICNVLNPDNPYAFDVWNIVFLAGHGQIPMSTFREVMHACHHSHNNNDNGKSGHPSETHTVDWATLFLRGTELSSNELVDQNNADCRAALKRVDEQVGGVYAYGLYDECTYSNGLMRKKTKTTIAGGLNDYPCGGDIVMTQYLNMSAVRDALHVEKSEFFAVDNADGFDYTPTEPDLTSFYKEMNGKLRILVYNGDTDPAINSFAAQNWTSHLGFRETESWRPWSVDACRRMGGYVTRYDGDFDFLTIRGAGHMVPAIKAEASFTFMKSWIEGSDYPSYNKDCEAPITQWSSRVEVAQE